MSIRLIRGVYVADTACLLGELELGLDVNIWYGASIRGDVARIVIGPETNVQDNAVIHCDKDYPNVIGRGVTIGHGAVLHGESVGDGCLIGIGARLLAHSKIGRGCVVAAGALVPPGMVVPEGMLVMGSPARIVRETNEREKQYMKDIPPRYVLMAKLHHENPQDPRVWTWDAPGRN